MATKRESTDWFHIWVEDHEAIINTMLRNMQADLDAGYDPEGNCIRRQKTEIENYRNNYNAKLDMIGHMDPGRYQHWCYVDLIRRGAIAA